VHGHGRGLEAVVAELAEEARARRQMAELQRVLLRADDGGKAERSGHGGAARHGLEHATARTIEIGLVHCVSSGGSLRTHGNVTAMKSYLLRLCAFALALPFAAAVFAQESYPSKPVRLIVPFAAVGVAHLLQR